MVFRSLSVDFPRRLRALARAREISIVLIAAAIGVAAGLVVAAMGEIVNLLHSVLYNIPHGDRLSALRSLEPTGPIQFWLRRSSPGVRREPRTP